MRLLYLSADNLRNTPFVKDLMYNVKDIGKCILVHDHFGKVADTRFVTKRLSALISEELVTNNAFSGDQRGIVTETEAGIEVRLDFLLSAMRTVDLIVLNALGLRAGEVAALDPLGVVSRLRRDLGLERVHTFAKNSRSPIVAQARLVLGEADVAAFRDAYEEEGHAMDTAVRLAPAVLAAPSNFKSAL